MDAVEGQVKAGIGGREQRRWANAIWQPVLQFKLLMAMLGSTVVVAVLLGSFFYFGFGHLLNALSMQSGTSSFFAEGIEMQIEQLFRYCAALFVLYVILLGAVCVAYTHRLLGPLRPMERHMDEVLDGRVPSPLHLRKEDLEFHKDFAAKLAQVVEQARRAPPL